MKKETSIGELFFRYTRRELTTDQNNTLSEWRARSPANEALFQYETDPEHTREAIRKIYDLRDSVQEKIKTGYPTPWMPAPVKKYKGYQLALRIAATFIFVLFFFSLSLTRADYGIHPGRYQATPVDPDRAWGAISDMVRGYQTSSQKIEAIEKSNGELEYIIPGDSHASKGKNYEVNTPRGGMVVLRLPDGTSVWLNAESFISFPKNLSQDTISFKLEGEAYFEINDHHKKIYQIQCGPFRVSTSSSFFDINSYANESNHLMTLFKGNAGVQFPSLDSAIQMVSGQQTIANDKYVQTTPVTGDDVIGWKNKKTQYHQADIHTILSEAARWYNVDISYVGDFSNKKFSVNLPRSAEFSELRHQLEKQGVKISTGGHTVTVFSKNN